MISAGAFVAAGYALSYWLTFAFAYVDSSAAWRVPVAFQIIFSLPAIALLFFLPEVRSNVLLPCVNSLTHRVSPRDGLSLQVGSRKR